jgi:hypothetical protein
LELLRERLIGMLRGPASPPEVRPSGAALDGAPGGGPVRQQEAVQLRQSRGLEQFFMSFRDQAGLSILDLGGAHQENINFITNLGHRFYSEDFLLLMRESFGGGVPEQSNTGRIDYFLRQGLAYPEGHFDGVLAWDVLEYMEPPLLLATTEELLRVLKPKGYLLAFFQSAERVQTAPCYDFRIHDARTLQVGQNGQRQVSPQLVNNRSLEKLFQKFESVKFFLTRERLREVIVRK